MHTHRESGRWSAWWLRSVLGLALVCFLAPGKALAGDDDDRGGKRLRFDVAENGTRFVFAPIPVFDDGMPAYGNPFVTEGYVYPPGTLDGGNGVLANGDPEFPDKVIGRWTCRGWFVGDGARTVTGPWVVTTQIYDLGDAPGERSIVTDGFEVVDLDTPVERPITGGTGRFAKARGEGSQVLLGFNASAGVNLRFVLNVR